ncbi:MAG: nucleotidyltransferase domain-containing protein [Nanoarchaeota archaeon]|nr:nucleotidyltransferase domain-containing protein [Nanoarchaeota archaeon]MBU4301030.1 nucleotidyltransferase domain-containing protein [Nanoarchaeota archaeon]MBU4451714.1 nucleotidyltransferase domain-containing protein [Nanoarchaeota archaeon]MCG2723952.1 nucleotidyltransferase domain-containing protein [archaeon]
MRKILLEKIKKAFRTEKNVLFAYVYGSFGRGEKDYSDIDLAVFLKKIPKNSAPYEAKLGQKLEKETGKPVEVRIMNSMPLLLKSRVFKEGKTVFSRNKKARVSFETALMSRYLDFSYIMQEYDQRRLERYGIG